MNKPSAAAALTAAVLASAVAAAPPVSARQGGIYVETRSSTAVVCKTTTTDDRHQVQAMVYRNDSDATFFQIKMFENFGNFELVQEGFGRSDWSEGAVRGVGSLYDAHGGPLPGESAMSATYSVSDAVNMTVNRTQQGNQRVVAETTITPYDLRSVALGVSGLELKTLDCTASSVSQTLTYNTPAEFVDVSRSFEIDPETSCYLDEPAGEISAEVTGRELSIAIHNLDDGVAFEGTLHLHGDSAEGTLSMVDGDGYPAGEVTAHATVTRIGTGGVQEFDNDDFFSSRRVTPHRFDLTVDLAEGTRSVTCRMDKVTQRVRIDLPR